MTPTTGIGKRAAYMSWNPPKSLWSVKSCTRGIQLQLERVSVSKGPRNDGIQFSSLASSCSGRPAGRVNICLEPAKRRRPDHARSLDFTTTQLLRRSEEHTSELQSQSNLVCRLLLEKKKNGLTKQHQPVPSSTESAPGSPNQ